MNIEKLVTSPALIERSNFDICLVDPASLLITSVSEGMIAGTGFTRQELIGKSLAELNADYSEHALKVLLAPLIAGIENYLLVDTHRTLSDGSTIEIEGCVQCFPLPTGQSTLLIMSRVKTATIESVTPKNLTQELLDSCSGMVAITDDQLNILSVNDRFERFFAGTGRKVIGMPLAMALMPERMAVLDDIVPSLSTEGRWSHMIWCQAQQGLLPVKVTAERLELDASSQPRYLFSIQENILNGYLTHMSDETHILSRLQNREQFQEAILNHSNLDTPQDQRLAAVYLDIQDFKKVNDRFGFDQANEVIYAIAGRLQNFDKDTLALTYLGGDQFALLLQIGVEKREQTRLIENLNQLLTMPYQVANKLVHASFNFGLALLEGSTTADELLQKAEHAMNQAKANHGKYWALYNEQEHHRAIKQFEYEEELRIAVQKKQFMLVFQPQLDLATGKVRSAETLLRWNHPTRGLLGSGEFIHLLEETNMIVEVGEWIIRQACEFMHYWKAHNLSPIRVAVNISTKQLNDERIVSVVEQALASTGISPACLELEVTESCLIEDAPKAVAILEKLQSMGVTIAIDDFGTGYSSLTHIRTLPLNIIKIDKSFIDGINHNNMDRSIINVIIQMAKMMNMEVVAEGVEDQSQLDYLRSANCNKIQGFLFAKPMPAHEFKKFLQRDESSVEA